MSYQTLRVVNTGIINLMLKNTFDFKIIKALNFNNYIIVRNCYSDINSKKLFTVYKPTKCTSLSLVLFINHPLHDRNICRG
jgi:hypothetical protein